MKSSRSVIVIIEEREGRLVEERDSRLVEEHDSQSGMERDSVLETHGEDGVGMERDSRLKPRSRINKASVKGGFVSGVYIYRDLCKPCFEAFAVFAETLCVVELEGTIKPPLSNGTEEYEQQRCKGHGQGDNRQSAVGKYYYSLMRGNLGILFAFFGTISHRKHCG